VRQAIRKDKYKGIFLLDFAYHANGYLDMSAATFKHLRQSGLQLLLALSLSACATKFTLPTQPAEHLGNDIRQLQHWQASGKASTRVFGKTVSGTFSWQRIGDGFEAEGAGPLDQGRTTVIGQEGMVLIQNSSIGTLYTDDPEKLTEELAYTPIPPFHLNAWLSGWPKEAETAISALPADQGVREFHERGWHIQVISEQIVDNYRIPERIIMTWDHRRVIVAINSWQATTP
jgi:outer membrane lipoprotein LolB